MLSFAQMELSDFISIFWLLGVSVFLIKLQQKKIEGNIRLSLNYKRPSDSRYAYLHIFVCLHIEIEQRGHESKPDVKQSVQALRVVFCLLS